MPSPADQEPLTPQVAFDLLMEGNERWASGRVEHPCQSVEIRESLVGGQSPFAVIVSCIDSRVPPELVFDRGLGDLLVVRSAAHVLDDLGVGSVEFGPRELGTPLILVLGHRGCRAAHAAVESFRHDRWPPGHIEDIVEAMRPAYRMAVGLQDGELIDRIVVEHVLLTVARLRREQAFTELLRADRLGIVGGCYDLGTGRVDIVT